VSEEVKEVEEAEEVEESDEVEETKASNDVPTIAVDAYFRNMELPTYVDPNTPTEDPNSPTDLPCPF
jgi:hypothetical protein